MTRFESWGRFPRAAHAAIVPVVWRSHPPDLEAFATSVLPFGQGRSYGDSCLNDGGVLLDTGPLSRLILFDKERGVVRCEAGLTLAELLRVIVPRGWFLPVTPGTKFVSVGGAIAHDVHGKNHHHAGTFGRYVRQFELLRSSGDRVLCSPEDNSDLYRATVGGMGLTGLILWAEIALRPISSPLIQCEGARFPTLDAFFELTEASDPTHEYTVAWIDCLAGGKYLGRGVFFRGDHVAAEGHDRLEPGAPGSLRLPIDLPAWTLNPYFMKLLNTAYYYRHPRRLRCQPLHYERFFYPLDRVREWNRIYGTKGLLQYQCVVPRACDGATIRAIMRQVVRSGQGSFLAVLKSFGDLPSPGLLSFPRPGVTLALDFPHRGAETLALLDRLDGLVREAGGAVYPAKDARMSAESFRAYFPRWSEFARYVDPKFSSSFWRRVAGPGAKGNGCRTS